MKWFNKSSIKSLDDLKKAYRRLAMENHPDRGGTVEAMQEINNEYDELFPIYKAAQNRKAEDGKGYATMETPDDFKQIIEVLIHLDGLEIELCGCWLWIGGDTKRHKDALKKAGCNWCSKKKLWSWHPDYAAVHTGKRRRTKSMEYIRNVYGSEIIGRGTEQLGLA